MIIKTHWSLLSALALLMTGCGGDPGAINLHSAIMRSDLASVKAQIESGVSVEATDSAGRTPLYVAALYKNPDIVRYLLAQKADPNRGVSWKSNRLPLHAASQVGNVEIISIFLDAGIDVNAADTAARTPLHEAAQNFHPEAVRFLLAMGANAKVISKTGYTPLTLSYPDKISPEQFPAYRQVLAALFEHGADVNTANGSRGITPLIYAAFNGDAETVQFLVDRGANPNLNSRIGENGTALGVATREGNTNVVAVLRSLMKKETAQQQPAP